MSSRPLLLGTEQPITTPSIMGLGLSPVVSDSSVFGDGDCFILGLVSIFDP